jgi:hypothetical protein
MDGLRIAIHLTKDVITLMIRSPRWAFTDGTAPQVSQTTLIRFLPERLLLPFVRERKCRPGRGPPTLQRRPAAATLLAD